MPGCFLLIMQAIEPTTGEVRFFVEKCLSFGTSVSCARFQLFSDSLKHMVEFLTGWYLSCTNYLDDYLFCATSEEECNQMVSCFLDFCKEINCLVSLEKTEWATPLITFLGILLNGKANTLSIPVEKQEKAVRLLEWAIHKRKVTIHFIQRLTGTLNFLNKAIVPGRTFLRAMYNKLRTKDSMGQPLKQYHHVYLDSGFLGDCTMWLEFLDCARDCVTLCRPFIDLDQSCQTSKTLNFYSDSSRNLKLGLGAVFDNRWIVGAWGSKFITEQQPSIQYLELYALVAAVLTWDWDQRLHNMHVKIFCDNKSVHDMVNGGFSNCMQCMKLIRLLTLNNLKANRKITVEYVDTKWNILADAISRFQFKCFWSYAPRTMHKHPDKIADSVWPPMKVWSRKY